MIGYGNSYFISTILDTESGTPPVNTVAPAITGTAQEGQTVSCSTGTWTGTPTITYAYQWKRNGSNIGSATNSTYLLAAADVGQSITCQVTATNGAGSASATSNTITPIAAVDPDAQAFVTNAGIVDQVEANAINNLVIELKADSLWTKMKAIYPMVGGTSSSTSYNLKNPAQFQITWNGGVTWSNNGVLFGGVNGYGDTGYNLSTQSTTSNVSGGVYLRTNVQNDRAAFGVRMSNVGLALYPKHNDTNTYWSVNDFITAGASTSIVSDTRGLFVLNKISLTEKRIYRNGSQISTATPSSNSAPNGNVWLGAANNFGSYDSREQAFAFLGDTLTNTEVSNLYTAVQNFQVALSRNI